MEPVEYMENSEITAGFSGLKIQKSAEACQASKALHIIHFKQSVRLQEMPPYSNPFQDIHWTCPFNKVSNLRPALDQLSS